MNPVKAVSAQHIIEVLFAAYPCEKASKESPVY